MRDKPALDVGNFAAVVLELPHEPDKALNRVLLAFIRPTDSAAEWSPHIQRDFAYQCSAMSLIRE